MQLKLGFGQTESERFATQRIAGETLQSLQILDPGKSYDAHEMSYRDSVDDPYTLKRYSGSTVNGKPYEFLEVLPMALTEIAKVGQRRDTGLLELGMEILKGGRSK